MLPKVSLGTKSKVLDPKSKKRLAETVNNHFYEVQEEDIIYLILGQTGAGKSTFINHAIGHDVASVGHNLSSHTIDIQPFLMDSARHIVLVDTPGFNDTWDSDQAIVRRIIDWLATSCKPGQKFGGAIYLYEMTQARDNPKTSFMHPTKLSEPEAPKYVILATVKWNEIPLQLGQLRETQLIDVWRMMGERGSQMARFNNSTESALQILSMFPSQPVTTAVIDKELRRILGILPADPSKTKYRGEGLISKLFGKLLRPRG